MNGSVFRRGKTWVGQIDLGDQAAQRCDACGRQGLFWIKKAPLPCCPRCGGELRTVDQRRRDWQGGFRRQKDSQDWVNERIGSVRTGTYAPPSKQTVEEYLSEWLLGVKASLRPSTWASYSTNVEKHIKPAIGRVPLQRLATPRLNAMYAELLESKLSPRTVRYIHTILRKALADAGDSGDLAINVAAKAKPPKSSSPEMKTWTAEELRAFLASIREDRLYAAWLLAAMTGCRRGEILGLPWRDVNFETGRIAIRQTLVNVGYTPTFSTPKTKTGRRSVALDPGTVAALKAHRKAQLEERMEWGPAWQDHGLVFTRENGSPVHPDRFRGAFDSHVKAAGLPRIRLHDLRHTYATLALSAGVHPKVVSERLGHATISITLDIYSHAVPALEEDAAAKVAGIILGS